MSEMSEEKAPLFKGDVYAMLAKLSLQATVEEIKHQKSLEHSEKEKRDILRKKDNVFKGESSVRGKPM